MRVARVGSPPGSVMSKVSDMPRAELAGRRRPKSIRSSVWSALDAATVTLGFVSRAETLKLDVFGGTAR